MTDDELIDALYRIVTEDTDDHEDVVRRMRALMAAYTAGPGVGTGACMTHTDKEILP